MNFWCRLLAVVILKSLPEWPYFRGSSPNLKIQAGTRGPLSTFPPGSGLWAKKPKGIRSTLIPASLHLGGFQPFDGLRDHPFVPLWIPKQSAPMPVKVGLGRLNYHHSGRSAPCGEGIRIQDEETKANPWGP